jgi:hypothetical protein
MACCTTIPPLNSAQKRGSGAIFDMPRSAKRRRPVPGSTLTSSLSSSALLGGGTSMNNSATMFTTTSSILTSSNRPVVIEQNSGNRKDSPFASAAIPAYMPISFNISHNEEGTEPCGSIGGGPESENQFKSELMERIKVEARRLVRRKQLNLSTITNSLSINTAHNDSDSAAAATSSSVPPHGNDLNSNQALLNNQLLKSNNHQHSVSSSSITSLLAHQATTANTTNQNKLTGQLASSTSSLLLPSSSSVVKASDNSSNTSKLAKMLSHNDLPLFSMNQVNQICERMMKEREQLLRDEYDKILTQKLNEQYDAFVKFTHEQIQRRFESSQCTYVS